MFGVLFGVQEIYTLVHMYRYEVLKGGPGLGLGFSVFDYIYIYIYFFFLGGGDPGVLV